MDVEWIRQGLEKPGKTKVGLAKALFRSPSVVTQLLSGARALKAQEVRIIANYLEVEPPEFSAQVSSDPVLRKVPVLGAVQAGNWVEASEDRAEPDPLEIFIDPRFSDRGLFALRIRGESINRQAPDGAYAVCLDIFQAPRAPMHMDWVVARRKEHDRIETTVKQLRVVDGKQMLFPDSSDPRYQTPVELGRHEGEEVEIRAFVLDFVKPGTRL